MHRTVHRLYVGGLLVVALLLGSSSSASADTVTIGLRPFTSQDVNVEVAPGQSVMVQRVTSGDVTFGGAIVGKYVMRSEFSQVNNTSTTGIYPSPLVTITIRLDPPTGTRFDTMILHGSHPGIANPDNITIIGGVSAATGILSFLRGAQWVTAVGVGDVPLTFTF